MVKSNDEYKYIFAEINQKTASFTFRVNYTINPVLTIEYYGSPFASEGKYTHFKKITDPKANTLRKRFYEFSETEISLDEINNEYNINETGNSSSLYAISNPDFNFREFRSNLVIRWEYLPGSTLYLVWSQGRTSYTSNNNFSYRNEMKELFDTTPHNVFLIKLSYWFSL
ncbi:MAG: hypothetical protein HC905_16760 [Bacteroidales bacterium]|nr:hypothetical protein [Bacteroidales bacterium]